ncbi:hypothetical protein BC834DRAFT_852675 [Gloeopeniophorella convolvens]|nr:hypothetical protein BC834DRAFT_852675 [Gloeopeniophorella convolvens]
MPGLTPAELQDIVIFTIGLAHRAGALILEGSQAIQRADAGDVGAKKNAIDLVTEYDVRVEELVRNEIAQTSSCAANRALWCVVLERSRTPQASDPRSRTPRRSASTRSTARRTSCTASPSHASRSA